MSDAPIAGRDHGRATITAKRLAAALGLQGLPATPLAIRDRAILLLTFASGRRRAEIAGPTRSQPAPPTNARPSKTHRPRQTKHIIKPLGVRERILYRTEATLMNIPGGASACSKFLRPAIGAASCGLALAIGASPAARAATTPTVYLDYGNVGTAGSLLRATRVPILTSNGVIIYKDVTIQLGTNATGTLTLTWSQQLSPPIYPNLVPGIYYLPGYPTYALDVTGPGPGGIYTIAAAPKYNPACGGPATVSAYTTANKQYNRLQAAGIKPDPNTLYGIIGGPVNGGSYCQGQPGGF